MNIRILKAGLQTTIQDLGRQKYREFGISASGALDQYSHQIANWLVGNDNNKPTLEVTHIGPTLQFEQDVSIGIAGAEFELFVNDRQVSMNTTLHMQQGDVLKFGKLKSGARAYVAFSGELKLPLTMNSASTNILANFGGFKGRALNDGDLINLNATVFKETRVTPNKLLKEHHHNLQQNHIIVRVTQGREFEQLSQASRKSFLEENFTVSSDSNRMALKLEEQSLDLKDELSMTTTPIIPGTIQLPENGSPIITLADGQTTGGYPRIAQVISADLSLLGQLKPKFLVSFYEVSIGHAIKVLKEKEKYLNTILHSEVKSYTATQT